MPSTFTNLPLTEAAPRWLVVLLAAACGLIGANLYYAQPLIGPISASLGLSSRAAGLIVTMSQLGYGLGLLFVVPLGDLIENRRLVTTILSVAVLALLGASVSRWPSMFLAAALLIGFGSVAVQVLVPYAAHLVSQDMRGRVVGNVMSGLMLGIMLARPVSSLVADLLSWRAVFMMSSALIACLTVFLAIVLPARHPSGRLRYHTLLTSMFHLLRDNRVLQRRSLYHAFLFGTFSLYWTVVPLVLTDRYHLSQKGIALFALVGVAGAVSAPFAGRAADRGWTTAATFLSMITVAAALVIGANAPYGSPVGLVMLLVAAILVDTGVAAHFVLGQRAMFLLGADIRSRLNGLYMAIFFSGGALCSALGGWAYAHGGWGLTMRVAIALPLLAIACYLTESWDSRVRD
ncbi:MFS transporter [Paraburkholderia sp. XV]|uniref:MFS transporter n=1 Tax=Paraburkholderia sp. XV TaxID=2831520 RepID=UPI001CD52900|nr:MFS transporter [Paraburkholderia sp. XV]